MTAEIPIVFRNRHFLVVNKPGGVLSVRARLGPKDPRPVLWDLLETQLKQKVFGIHRLDFEVSGIMLWALTKEAQVAGNGWFERHQVEKQYLALTEPHSVTTELPTELPPDTWLTWDRKLLRGKKRTFESPHGQQAITNAYLLSQTMDNGLRQWVLRPRTGRAHQLRFELSNRGYPIQGDVLYGAKALKDNSISLQAQCLRFKDHSAQTRWDLPTYFEVSADTQLFPLAPSLTDP
jgi:tRNA pseudouridine32 synthase / 23S rRNA pseudouridine746 synthase